MSVRVTTAYNNFARGQVDVDLDGRFDLPIYNSGSKAFENYISNFKGNAIYRSGLENLIEFQDCAFIEFKFSDNQNYIAVLYANKMRFLSYDSSDNFGWVLNPSPTVFEVDTPYSLAESKEIAFKKAYTQNFDSMIFTHPDHPPYELVRLAADEFRFRPNSRKDDPFPLTWDTAKNITGITKAAEAQLTVVGHSYSVNDRVKISSITGMAELNDWTATVIEVVDADNFKVDIDSTDFTTYTSGGTTEEVLTGDYPTLCLYYKSRLYYGATDLKTTTIYASEAGNYRVHTLPVSVVADSALQFTIAELTSAIVFMFPGQNSLIVGSSSLIVAVNGGSVGAAITAETIDTIKTSADGSSSVQPIDKDGLIFYVSNDGRNVLYFSYDLLTETFVAKDANVIHYDITKGKLTKLRHVKNKYDLLFGIRGDGEFLSCVFNVEESIIGWHPHGTPSGLVKDIAQISDNNGNQQLFTLTLRGSTYFIERQAEYIEFSKRKDFYTNTTSKKIDDDAYYRTVAEELKQCNFLDNSSSTSDLRTTSITYDSVAGTVTDAGAGFVSGDVGKHIVYKTATGYESGRFEITSFTSTSVVKVEVLQEPTATTYASWYLTFSTLSGLTRFANETIAVVADGGFLADFAVDGSGNVDLGTQVTHVVVGRKYRGYINSFVLGFQVKAENTQTTMKAISQFGLRCHNTAGGKVGTDQYRLEPVQNQKQGDLNYLPPLPISGTKYVSFPDNYKKDKEFVIIQDVPLPMVISCVMVDANYGVIK